MEAMAGLSNITGDDGGPTSSGPTGLSSLQPANSWDPQPRHNPGVWEMTEGSF
jgi:hypothetical protein